MKSISDDEQTPRPFGYWLKAVDRSMAAEFAAAFESEGITRREWRLLNRIDGTVADDARPLPVHKLDRLIELGWVTDAEGTWTLTDDGRSAKERLAVIVEGIRKKVNDAAPAEDLAITMATLEQVALAFGWDENTPLPRDRGRGRRHGWHGFDPHDLKPHDLGRHGFGPREAGHDGEHGHPHGMDHGHHCRGDHGYEGRREHEHNGHGHPRHGHPNGGRARFARFAQGAYERGFDAGFSRGRADQ